MWPILMSLLPFQALNVSVALLSAGSESSLISSKILICLPKMNKDLTGLEQNEGE